MRKGRERERKRGREGASKCETARVPLERFVTSRRRNHWRKGRLKRKEAGREEGREEEESV